MTQKKKAPELTTEGLAKRLFPPEVRDEVKREVAEKKEKTKKKGNIKHKGR